MVSYAMSGGTERNSVANVTIDTPSIIFSLDPLFALLAFASAPFKANTQETQSAQALEDDNDGKHTGNSAVTGQPANQQQQAVETAGGGLAYRVNVVQASVKLLADPTKHDSEAIVLSIRQVQLAQQGTLILSVDHMGIFLCKMNKPKETIRILDDFDLQLSMDNRQEDGQKNCSIELDVQAIVIRLSSRDVALVSSIATRAMELSGSQAEIDAKKAAKGRPQEDTRQRPTRPLAHKSSSRAISTTSKRTSSAAAAAAPNALQADVVVTRETVSVQRPLRFCY